MGYRSLSMLLALLACQACDSPSSSPDAGQGPSDAGSTDAGSAHDAGMQADAGRSDGGVADGGDPDPTCPTIEWNSDTFEGSAWFLSATSDAQGTLHAVAGVFTGEVALTYMRLPQSGTWTSETIDTDSDGHVASVALDGAGQVHVAFAQWSDRKLYLASRAPDGTWSSSEIGGPFDEEVFFLSLAIDSEGGAHLAYHVGTGGDVLSYVTRPAGGSWSAPVTVDDEPFDAIRVAIDPDDGVHIAYARPDAPVYRLRHAYRSAGESTWTTETVLPEVPFLGWSDLAIDALGGLHVTATYDARSGGFDDPNKGLWYVHRPAGGEWAGARVTPAHAADQDGWFSSVVIDARGGVHVAHLVNVPGDPELTSSTNYSYRAPGGEWTTTRLGDALYYPYVAVDAQGLAHVLDSSDDGETRRHFWQTCP